MKSSLVVAATLLAASAAFAPLPAAAQIDVSIVVGSAPPPPRFESVPAPRRGYVWAPGYWNYDGYRYTWISGHWERARSGYQYMPHEWVRDRDGWRLSRGGWHELQPGDYDVVRIAPPPPRYEPEPYPRAGYLWVPGHWEWRGNRYVWESGTWLRERRGYAYQHPQWVHRNGRWHMNDGRWYEHRGRRHDADRDGVPNRYDRDRDNDGVPNRYDRDRDGDDRPNYYDNRPDNPRR